MSNEPGCSSSTSKRKHSESEDDETRKEFLKAARLANHVFDNDQEEEESAKQQSLEAVMAVVQPKTKGHVISNAQLEYLYRAICPHEDKEYDSDDSINSESDNIPADVAAKESEAMRKTFANMKEEMAKEAAVIEELFANTPERRAARRRAHRDWKLGAAATDQEKEEAEAKYQAEWTRLKKKIDHNHQVFIEQEKKTMRYITRARFADHLELLADVMPANEDVPRELKDPYLHNHAKAIDFVKISEFTEKLKSLNDKSPFFKGDLSVEDFILVTVKKILLEKKIRGVLNHPKYGFDYSTKDCVEILASVFSRQKDFKDDGSSIEPLAVNIGDLISAAWKKAREANDDYEGNDKLKEFARLYYNMN